MRPIQTKAVATLVLAAATAPAQAIDFTFLTHESLVGVLSVDGFLGNGDDFVAPGLNTLGAASQFIASNATYGFLGGAMTTAGVTPFGLVEQQFFGVSTHTSNDMFGEWSHNALGMFNIPIVQSLDVGSPSVITLHPDQSYTTSFVLHDSVSGGRLAITGSGHYLRPFQDPSELYSGDLLTHFETVVPLLPDGWAGVAQENQFWEVLDGPRAGVTGFTSSTFYSLDSAAVPLEPTPVALPAPWQTSGWASTSEDQPNVIQIGSSYAPAQDGTATLSDGAVVAADVVNLGGLGAGTLNVTGMGSLLTNRSLQSVAAGGGTLNIAAGAQVDATLVVRSASGPLSIQVDGAGSQLNLHGDSTSGFSGILDVGAPNSPLGTDIAVTNGGSVRVSATDNASALIYSAGSTLHLDVDGTGSRVSVTGTSNGSVQGLSTGLYIEQSSAINVTNGGVVEVTAANVGNSGIGLGAVLADDATRDAARLVIDGAGSRVDAGPLLSAGAHYEFDPSVGSFFETSQPGGTSIVTVRNGGVLEADRILIGGNGTLNGSGGTLIGNVENHGVVAVGESPGTMVIEGDYVQGVDGRLVIEIGGTTPGVDFDLLTVNGTMTLGGTLEIVLLNGFVPDADDSFGFLSATNIVGAFANILLPTLGNGQPLALHFGPTGITAGAAPIPVPGAVWLFGGAVAVLARRRRARGDAMAPWMAG
ncbi:MAG: hypothetical protein AB7I01_13500 [Gammaproteobacteria bacterium]